MIVTKRMTVAVAAVMIASISLSASASADKTENCDTILWSKASPGKAVVIRHLENDNTAFLSCSGHLDKKKKKHVMDRCRPIEAERKYYTQEELKENWKYLIKRSAKDNFGPVLTDTLLGFFISEIAVGWIGQSVARSVATAGEQIASMGPGAARAVESTGKVLGGGTNLFEGSKAVANDSFLRFFPSYIGAATGFVGAGIKNIKNGDLNRSMQRASSMSPFGYRAYACGPRELHDEFTGTRPRTPSIQEFEETLRSALRISRERPDSWAMTERKYKEMSKSLDEKSADQSPPVLSSSAEGAALK